MNLETLILKKSAHTTREEGVCVMEAVAWLAGEEHSDHPACTCPVIAAVAIGWNDAISDDETRTRLLLPILPRLIGTRSTSDMVMLRRMWLAMDWQIRTYAPAFLKAGGFAAEAEALASLPEIVDQATLYAALPAAKAAYSAAQAAKNAAYSAAWNAAQSAARNAAQSAARNAALSAAWNAAPSAARNAAWNAASNAAYSAAYSAASNAALNAASDVLAPIVAELQASARNLIVRMCEVS
jgi:hypothetical protein